MNKIKVHLIKYQREFHQLLKPCIWLIKKFRHHRNGLWWRNISLETIDSSKYQVISIKRLMRVNTIFKEFTSCHSKIVLRILLSYWLSQVGKTSFSGPVHRLKCFCFLDWNIWNIIFIKYFISCEHHEEITFAKYEMHNKD